jgi:hypothetical protein
MIVSARIADEDRSATVFTRCLADRSSGEKGKGPRAASVKPVE